MPAAFDANVTVIVELGFGSGPLANPAAITWTDVSAYVKAAQWQRGRTSVQTGFPAGTGTVTLGNSDGRFYPWNTSSPYSPNVLIGVPIRIRATHSAVTYPLFRGYVRAWPLAFPTGVDEVVSIPVVETYHRVFDLQVSQFFSGENQVSAALHTLLTDAGWPQYSTGLRDIGLSVEYAPPGTYEGSLGGLMGQIAETEQGHAFQAASGALLFLNRIGSTFDTVVSFASQATFGPSGAELTYVDVQVAFDDDSLINEARITASTGATQESSDAVSVAAHGPVTYVSDNPWMIGAPTALNVAEWIVGRNKDVEPRIVGLTIDPAGSPAALWPEVLGRDLRDVITVEVTYPGSAVQLVQAAAVESIAHSFEAGGVWIVAFGCHPLSDLEQESFWVLGTSALNSTANLA